MSLGSWQPDIVGISLAKKKIAFCPKVTLPGHSYCWPVAHQGAYSLKAQFYSPLITALQYVNSGWTFEILPWVVRARGMVRADLLTPIMMLDFLEIPKQNWTGIIEIYCPRIGPSVEELAYMNRIRFSIFNQNNSFDTDDPNLSCASYENLLSVGNKRKTQRDTEDLCTREKNGSESFVIENSCTVPPTTEIDSHLLPLRDANATVVTTCIFVLLGKPLCSYVPACVCVRVLVRVCLSSQDCGLGARAKFGQS